MASGRARVEAALGRDLANRPEIGEAEKAALRAQARAVDVAEARRDSDAVTRASAVYLSLRTAAGLSAKGQAPTDAWDKVLADAMRPSPGRSDAPDAV